jgi:hypothetical protein
LFITEGVRKGDAAISIGLCCIGPQDLSSLRFKGYVGYVLPAIHATKHDLAAAQEAKE